jgi:radical SAM-linked protein
MKYCLTFEKTGNLRYISHLDLMRLFQRTFRRARFRLRYSEGFNPHPRMSFAQPLSLGYIGLGEVLEFETTEPLVPFDVPDLLNALLPPGVRVTACKELPEGRKESLSALTVSASYDLYLDGPVCLENAPESIVSAFLAQDSILAEKRIKKTKQNGFVEIRPLIRSFAFVERLAEGRSVYGMDVPAGSLRFRAVLATGPVDNLNPEVLLRAFSVFAGLPFDKTSFRAVREGLTFREPSNPSA